MNLTNEQIQALKAAAESQIGILENIAGYEPSDIDCDDVELRFETEEGFDAGCNVSIVEQCQKSADVIRSLLAEREADKALIAESVVLFTTLRDRIAELEARTLTVKLPDNCEHDVIAPVSAFMYESGLEIDTEDYNALAGRVRSEVETVLRRTLRAAGITLVVGGEDADC